MAERDEEEVRRRAYSLWMERGCPDGSPEIDWHRAQAELLEQGETDLPRPGEVGTEARSSTAAADASDGTATRSPEPTPRRDRRAGKR